MKITNISVLILSTALTSPAFASTGVSLPAPDEVALGADYIQASNIIGKTFNDVASVDGECDTEARLFIGNKEQRLTYSSINDDVCKRLNLTSEITESTLSYLDYEMPNLNNFQAEYDPKFSLIIEEMHIGQSWGGESNEHYSYVYNDTTYSGTITRTDTFTLNSIEDILVGAQSYEQCLNIDWTTIRDSEFLSNFTLWFCPEIGLVKYTAAYEEDSEPTEIWELESYEEDGELIDPITVSGADYIPPANILSKSFKDLSSDNGLCDLEYRDYANDLEIRTITNSSDDTHCRTDYVENIITENTFTQVGYTINGQEYSYDPGIPLIAETMTVGKSWTQTLDVSFVGNYYKQQSTSVIEDIEDVSVAAGNFKECLKINWQFSDQSYYLWICPGFGLVKFSNTALESNWELQSYEEDVQREPVTVSGANYIQSSDISSKHFELKGADIDECNVENRFFDGEEETRFITNSNKGIKCEEYHLSKKVTESTLDYVSQTLDRTLFSEDSDEVIGRYYNNISFDPGRPIIIDLMTVGKSWSQVSMMTVAYGYDYINNEEQEDSNGDAEIQLEDKLTLESIADITAPAGHFQQCLRVYWTSTYIEYDYTSNRQHIWICPEVGLVKFNIYTNEVIGTDLIPKTLTWELQKYNHSPTISGEPATSINEDEEFSFTPAATDEDQDELNFSIENKPEWAEFDTATGALTGTPNFDQAGIYTDIIISVTDGEVTASLPAFSITVNNVNHVPTISGEPTTAVTEGGQYSFTPEVSDEDQDKLTFSIENKPEWAEFDTATGTLSGTPAEGNAGLFADIVISVSDNVDSAELDAFTITVIATEAQDEDNNSGGGGNLPLSLLAVLGLIAIRKRK